MKIWFQKHTISGRLPWLDRAYEEHFRDVLPEGVHVDVHTLPEDLYAESLPADYVRYGQLETLFSWYFADRAVDAEAAGYDAYVIGTSQDPGLGMARSLVSIPVIGYGDAAYQLFNSLHLPFGVIGFIPELEEALRYNMRQTGMERLCVGFAYMPSGRELVEDALATGDGSGLIEAMTQAADGLRAAGAQVVLPGEGLPNEVLWEAGVRNLGALPLIDANGLAVATAEFMARTRRLEIWSRGTSGYGSRRVDPGVFSHVRNVIAKGLG